MTSLLKNFCLILLFFLFLFLYGKFGPGLPISQTSIVTQKQDLFTVSGQGKVSVVPDTAVLTLGITTDSPQIKAAQNQANTIINKVAQNLKSLGVDSKDIKTTSYHISPKYNYQSGTSHIDGYTVSIYLSATVRNLDQLSPAIDQSVAAGVTNVGGIQLTINEARQKELAKQARDQAVKEAKTRAEELASAAVLNLGRIINIQESNTSQPEPIYAKSSTLIDLTDGKTNIQPGTADITSSVTLTYETR